MGNNSPARSRYDRRRAGSAIVSLLRSDLKPAPSAPRSAATGLTSILRRAGGDDAANDGFCPLSSKRLNMDADRTTLRIVT